MKKRLVSTTFLLVASLVAGCGYDGPSATVDELREELKDYPSGIILLDVRSPVPYKNGHVPGALNVPLDKIPAAAPDLVGGKRKVFVICTCGKKALKAASILQAKGINAVLVKGGTKAWTEAGYPLETQ